MHVELIGSTSAGKTTLAKKMVEAGINNGSFVYLSDDFMLNEARLNWIKNEFIRRRVVELIALAGWLIHYEKYKEFSRFVIHEGMHYPGSLFYKANRIRNVLRKVGIYEFISRKSKPRQIILADNEGILQGVHNLFVHQNHQVDREKIARYVELVPMPDVVLYLQQEENVLILRTLKRGHARVAEGSQDKAIHFIKQAIVVFNELISDPKLKDKLLIIDGELNIQQKIQGPNNMDLDQVKELVQLGRMI